MKPSLKVLPSDSNIIGELVRADTAGDLRFAHAVMTQVSLPYRNAGRTYEKTSGPWHISLSLKGRMAPAVQHLLKSNEASVAFGPTSRLILMSLQTRAIKIHSPEVPVEPSFTAFARDIGLDTGGRSISSLKEHVRNLSLTNMNLSYSDKERLSVFSGPIFSKFELSLKAPSQGILFPDIVRFNAEYFHSLQNHAVPLRGSAILALSGSARALDLYSFLAYRLHHIRKPVIIRWRSLNSQFADRPGGRIESFKRRFLKCLSQVKEVYPEARVDVVEGGIKLLSSPPPVRPLSRY
jgi:hypothetical protein